ncbi:MAG: hypothetical protein HXY39_13505 [Chloroflexi bacterium]|nr:hypothetical protein [Chloroflexota bacterium]
MDGILMTIASIGAAALGRGLTGRDMLDPRTLLVGVLAAFAGLSFGAVLGTEWAPLLACALALGLSAYPAVEEPVDSGH